MRLTLAPCHHSGERVHENYRQHRVWFGFYSLYIFKNCVCARTCVYACAPVLWRLRSKKTSRSQGSLSLDHAEPENGTEVRPNIEHLLWCLGSPPNGTCKETLSHPPDNSLQLKSGHLSSFPMKRLNWPSILLAHLYFLSRRERQESWMGGEE